jgi:hypothetical protein
MTMFVNLVASPLDESFYLPSKHYVVFDVDISWQTVEYNDNLFKL